MLFLCKCLFAFAAGFGSFPEHIKDRFLAFDGLLDGYRYQCVQHRYRNTNQPKRGKHEQKYQCQDTKKISMPRKKRYKSLRNLIFLSISSPRIDS